MFPPSFQAVVLVIGLWSCQLCFAEPAGRVNAKTTAPSSPPPSPQTTAAAATSTEEQQPGVDALPKPEAVRPSLPIYTKRRWNPPCTVRRLIKFFFHPDGGSSRSSFQIRQFRATRLVTSGEPTKHRQLAEGLRSNVHVPDRCSHRFWRYNAAWTTTTLRHVAREPATACAIHFAAQIRSSSKVIVSFFRWFR